jgi:transcriptional regulator with XRE-family HTH domain
MDSLSERITKILELKNLNARTFAKAIGCNTVQAIYDLTSGKTQSLSANMQNKITSYVPDLSIEWLLTGEGEMLKSAAKEAAASIPTSTVSLEKLYALIEQLVKQGEMNAEANLRNAKANEQNAANIARLIDGYMGGYKGAEERKIS